MASQNPTALVTGGAKRVGRAIVEELTRHGWDVIFTYLSSQQDARDLAKLTGARAIQIDLSDPHRAEQFAFDLSNEIDRLD
ncbi:MAG TPA: SDR family NAD(P)-dependent oxidoreductase, partial [Tepidisphaeraceae bacterium]|nr:SDR family NAD(P)-dependent oxidoreductase [Tepidisphaeraceae bacterium]